MICLSGTHFLLYDLRDDFVLVIFTIGMFHFDAGIYLSM